MKKVILVFVFILIIISISSFVYGYGKGAKFYAYGRNIPTWSCQEKYIRSARREKLAKILTKDASLVNFNRILSRNGFVAATMHHSDKPKFNNQTGDAILQIQYVGNPDIWCFIKILFQRKKSIFLAFLQEKPMTILKVDKELNIVGYY